MNAIVEVETASLLLAVTTAYIVAVVTASRGLSYAFSTSTIQSLKTLRHMIAPAPNNILERNIAAG